MNKADEQAIARIISRKMLGEITPSEQRRLDQWLDADDVNRKIYARIAEGSSMGERQRLERQLDIERASENVGRRIGRTANAAARESVRRRKLAWMAGGAAACAVIAVVALVFAVRTDRRPASAGDAQGRGTGPVSLVLPSGETIEVGDDTPEIISTTYGTVAREGGALMFADGEAAVTDPESPQTTRLITGVGGDVSFVLNDGTKVWMNSGSELSFPLKFGPDERCVHLSGEAYFEVAADKDRPFVVYACGTDTRVLGTSFNVKAYPNEPSVATTLLSGRVVVEAGGERKELTPGTASSFIPATGTLSTAQVDVEAVIAWKEGYFIFRDEGLESVFRMLERWYDVTFEYDSAYSGGYTFNGKINKNVPLPETLETIRLAGGPAFEYAGKTVRLF